MIELSMQREIERLQRIRHRLDQEAERISREYAWLRQEGVLLQHKLKHEASLTEPRWVEMSQQFLQAYRVLEQQSDAFQATCEQYVRDTQRLQQAMGTSRFNQRLTFDLAV